MTERGPESLTTTLGQYKVRAKIGSGGMGDVFDAIHTGLNKRVAIKTLRKRFLEDEIVVARFLREGQLASRIRHPHIVDVTDVGMMGGLPCLVMEHLEGESLSAMIRREGRLSLDVIVDTLLPIIAAVDFAHEHGIVHRDIKPSNLFLARSWNGETVPKVLDFGISKLVHDSQQAVLTTDSAFVGTPHYASPELMRAEKDADGRSDQYSMGVILYEAATGSRPFADLGNNFIALAMAICKADYPPARHRNPEIPDAFDFVIQRSMALLAQDRFVSMRALGEALLPFASNRVRMIWGPTFAHPDGAAREPSATELLPRTAISGSTSAVNVHAPFPSGRGASVPSRPPFSGGVPSAPPISYSSPHSHPHSYSHSAAPPPRDTSGLPTPISQHHYHPASTRSGAPFPHMPSGEQGVHASAFDRMPSYGAGTSASSAARPRGSGMITLVLGVVVGIAILVSLVFLRSSRRAESAATATATATAAQTSFELDLQVTPSTATIEVDGVVASTDASRAVAVKGGPAMRLTRSYPHDGQRHVLRISAPGHDSHFSTFDEAHPPPALIALSPLPGSSAPPVAQPTGNAAAPPGAWQHRGAPVGKPKGNAGSSDNHSKTDNIDPFE